MKVTAAIHAVISRQDLATDAVTYEIEMSILGTSLFVPCPEQLIARLDNLVRGEDPPPSPTRPPKHTRQPQQQDLQGYDVGVLEGYDVGDHD
jgi:hypothetical protein